MSEVPAGQPQAVAVFGSARLAPGAPEYEEARRLGALLGRARAVVMTGGYDGAMAAVSEGARSAGGHVVGVTMAGWGQRREPNAWVHEERRASSLTSRIEMLLSADAWVAVAGGVGTLAELAVAWNTVQTGEADGRPLILMGPRWASVAAELADSLIVRPGDMELIHVAPDPDAVLRVLEEAGCVLGDDPDELASRGANATGR